MYNNMLVVENEVESRKEASTLEHSFNNGRWSDRKNRESVLCPVFLRCIGLLVKKIEKVF